MKLMYETPEMWVLQFADNVSTTDDIVNSSNPGNGLIIGGEGEYEETPF